jgi:hypothetical protein
MPGKTEEGKRKIRNYLIIGGFSLIILLATMGIAGHEQILRCDRPTNGAAECVVKQSILGVITLGSQTATGAKAITIGENCVNSDCKYRLELYADKGTVAVGDYTSNYNQLLDSFSRFNTFFTDTKNTNMQLSQQTNPILLAGIGAVFVVIWGYIGFLIWQVNHPSQKHQAVHQ